METLDVALIGHAPTTTDPRARAAALVRDVILGGQDGLVKVLGFVLGMAVATGDARLVITAGVAALLAESIAMAGVAFTASGAERQLVLTTRARLDRAQRERAVARAVALRRRLTAEGRPTETVAPVGREVDDEARAWTAELEYARRAPHRRARPVRSAPRPSSASRRRRVRPSRSRRSCSCRSASPDRCARRRGDGPGAGRHPARRPDRWRRSAGGGGDGRDRARVRARGLPRRPGPPGAGRLTAAAVGLGQPSGSATIRPMRRPVRATA